MLDSILHSDQTTINPPLLPRLANGDDIVENLLARNEHLSHFWFFKQAGLKALKTAIVPFSLYDIDRDTADITLLGPGPGNPNDADSCKIAINMAIANELLTRKRRSLFICLGHQLLCRTLGFTVEKRPQTLQGSQEEIDLFGTPEKVGFYNTFVPKVADSVGHGYELSTLPGSDEVIAIRCGHFIGYQFHPESILSQNGCTILQQAVEYLMAWNG